MINRTASASQCISPQALLSGAQCRIRNAVARRRLADQLGEAQGSPRRYLDGDVAQTFDCTTDGRMTQRFFGRTITVDASGCIEVERCSVDGVAA